MVSPQTLGVILVALGAALVWSPWAFVVAGVLLVVVPELLALFRRWQAGAPARRARKAFRDAQRARAGDGAAGKVSA